MKLMIVDDEPSVTESLGEYFLFKGYEVRQAHSGREALDVASVFKPDASIVDMIMPDLGGLQLIERLHQSVPGMVVLIVTGCAEITAAVDAIKRGAEHYFSKPADMGELERVLEGLRARESQRTPEAQSRICAESLKKDYLFLSDEKMARVHYQIEQVARMERVTTLILGETGTGKQHAARLVHQFSRRADGPFVEIHCGALPENLLESELFGYEAGAFTDAKRSKPGLFEVAQGGSIFLDEIGEMPPAVQVKLLKVLEGKKIRRLGGVRETSLDVRVIAATNRDLFEEVRRGKFRADLYYRINVFSIELPPLRSMLGGVRPLARFLYGQACECFGKAMEPLTPGILARLESHSWPGNVRELKNVLERLVISSSGPWPDASCLPEGMGPARPAFAAAAASAGVASIEETEWNAIEVALRHTRGNRSEAARLLKISRKTLHNKIKGRPALHN
jgi:two-component system response regulator AtoC